MFAYHALLEEENVSSLADMILNSFSYDGHLLVVVLAPDSILHLNVAYIVAFDRRIALVIYETIQFIDVLILLL